MTGSGGVHVQRPRHRGRRRAGRVAALGAARAARARVGEGRVRAAGAVRLLHGARRRRRPRGVRDRGHAGRGPQCHDGRRARSRACAISCAAAFVATGGSQCGFCTPGHRRARRVRDAGARRRSTAALAAHLCRCTGWRTVYEAIERAASTRRGTGARDLEPRPRSGPSSKAASRSGSAPTCRSAAAASPTTPRRATRWSRCRCRPDPTPTFVEAAGHAVGRRRVARTTRARRGGQGAGPAHDGRRRAAAAAAAAAPTAACGSRRRGSSPRTSSPTRRGASPAASPRRRSRTAARSAARTHSPRAGRGARAGRRARTRRARRVLARGRRAARAEATADRRDRGLRATARVDDRRRRRARSRPTPSPTRVRARRSTRGGTWPTSPARRSRAELRAFGLAEQAVLVEGALDAAGVDRATLDRRRRAARHAASSRRRVRAPVRACAFDDATGRARARRGARRGRRSARRGRAALLLLGAAHMALGWVLTEAIAVDPETGEVHDLTIRSFGIIRAKRHAADRRHDRRRRRARRSRVRPTRCSPRSPPRPGTRSRASKAPGPRRSPHARPAPPVCSGGESHARRPRSHAERAAGRGPVLARGARRRLARARRPGRPRPATGKLADGVEAQARQVLANIAAVLGDCGASLTDVAKTPRVRHRPRRLRDGQRGVRRGVRRPQARPARPSRSPACPPARSSRSKPGPTSAGDSPPIRAVPNASRVGRARALAS